MTKHTITLDGSFAIAKGPRNGDWRAEVTVDLAKLPEGILVDLLCHGLKQKVADAASGATTADEADGAMSKALAAIMAGEWSSRVAGSGVSEETRVQRQIARVAFKAKVDKAAWATFTGLSDADQVAKLDAIYAKNASKLEGAVKAKLAALAEERAQRKALEGAIDL